jgi:hypothetical protein
MPVTADAGIGTPGKPTLALNDPGRLTLALNDPERLTTPPPAPPPVCAPAIAAPVRNRTGRTALLGITHFLRKT